MKFIQIFYLLAITLLFACDDFPKDPENTLERIKGKTIRVGIAEDGKWSGYYTGEAIGIEAEIIKAYAKTLNANIEWYPGSQEHLIGLLKEYQIDIAIGGFTESSVFKSHAGFTQPYFTERIKIGAPSNITISEEIKNKKVLVKRGSDALLAVLENNGEPVIYDSLPGILTQLIVAPEDELKSMGLNISEKDLKEIAHVLAVPKGENGLLTDLEQFIKDYVKAGKS
ncbi:MAG: transporter substrate-binding domain-containing protein [Bacteroidia bacterium]